MKINSNIKGLRVSWQMPNIDYTFSGEPIDIPEGIAKFILDHHTECYEVEDKPSKKVK